MLGGPPSGPLPFLKGSSFWHEVCAFWKAGLSGLGPPAPGLPWSLVFRAEPGKEDVLLKIASAYEGASKRRIPPPNFGPLPRDGK